MPLRQLSPPLAAWLHQVPDLGSRLCLRLSYLCWCCLQIQPLVKHADSVLSLSKRIVGSTLVNFGVKHTFFAHFCAGEPCIPP